MKSIPVPARSLSGHFFEDYRPGQRFVHATPRTITQGDVALYQALTGSRSVMHCAEPVAQAVGHPSLPVDDLLVFHIAFGKTVPDISYNAVANLGYADLRFLTPVYIGDTVSCATDIIGVKENSSGKSGNVYVRSVATNQHGVPVLSWIRWVMVNKRDVKSPAPETVIPDLRAFVPPTELRIFARLRADRLRSEDTGSVKRFGDFVVGETIRHPAGMTLDETDHTLATKLYQNTARVHFDARYMAASAFGKRLVYGGHVISLCRALSHDGLENVLSWAAINGGAHRNPTFAGDTLHARTAVLDTWPLDKRVGALRLRMTGFKNHAPDSDAIPPELTVLDLDYTVLMPR
ncbi:MAG: MaoC family dehydratase [Betaproteobacteria bacterium]|nr:MaoC family dehydratase [Betaproteobacteria bacterium]